MTGSMATTVVLAASLGLGPLLGGIAAGWLVSGVLLAWKRLAGMASAAAMGLGVALYLGRQHHPNHAPSACNVDDVFNCDLVNTSDYSEISGVPIALIGAAFYAGVLVVSVMGLVKKDAYSRTGHVVTALSVGSVLYSLFLAWVSSQMGVWCLFCISLYGVNALLLAGGVLAARETGVSLGDGVKEAVFGKSDRALGTLAVTAAAVFVLSMSWYRGLGPAPAERPSADSVTAADVARFVEAEAPGVALDGTEPVYGNPQAPYTVAEWADFECPHCGIVAPELKKLADDNPDIKVVFRNYPLSNKCNPNVQSAFHEHACAAAYAAECARKQGQFWELSKLMFMNQQYLSPDDISTMAGQKGLDVAALTTCMADPGTDAAVKADIAAGEKAGVTGTPALFLQGAHGDGTWVKLKANPADIALIVQAHKKAGEPLPVGN